MTGSHTTRTGQHRTTTQSWSLAVRTSPTGRRRLRSTLRRSPHRTTPASRSAAAVSLIVHPRSRPQDRQSLSSGGPAARELQFFRRVSGADVPGVTEPSLAQCGGATSEIYQGRQGEETLARRRLWHIPAARSRDVLA